MPFKKIDYSQTIIYKLVCNDINIPDCYVGHTTDYTRRKQRHKTACNNINDKLYNCNVYLFIRDNGGWYNWSMVVIENYACNSSLEARKKERYYIEQLKATLNSNIPTRTIQQYYNDNKEKILEYKQEYYNDNKDKILEYKKTKYICNCGSTCRIYDKQRHFRSIKHQNFINNELKTTV